MEIVVIVFGLLNLVCIGLVLKRLSARPDLDKPLREEFAQNRKEMSEGTSGLRQELSRNLTETREGIEKRVEQLRDKNDEKLESIRRTVETRLDLLQKDNGEKLEKMRQTVDEKLQSTLEKRLGESFKQVNAQLEQVYKGLGEMQTLATNVSDFKRVLTNVKTRGTWGEVQLESLLEQVFIKDHYEKQVMLTPGSQNAVDFCIKLPDKSSKEGYIYLPIDAKFPLEDYQRLIAAEEKGDLEQAALEQKALITRIKLEAKSINQKYIVPPKTTDFAVLYLPIESMYAEVLRTPGLFETLQSTYRVTVAGPTTIAAILSSYQLGFRTLAIAEGAGEAWKVLTDTKVEFGKFGDLIEKARDKMVQATNTLDTAAGKSRRLESKLNKAQQLADKVSTTAENTSLLED
jgi:DNA recombination protein RmuC